MLIFNTSILELNTMRINLPKYVLSKVPHPKYPQPSFRSKSVWIKAHRATHLKTFRMFVEMAAVAKSCGEIHRPCDAACDACFAVYLSSDNWVRDVV